MKTVIPSVSSLFPGCASRSEQRLSYRDFVARGLRATCIKPTGFPSPRTVSTFRSLCTRCGAEGRRESVACSLQVVRTPIGPPGDYQDGICVQVDGSSSSSSPFSVYKPEAEARERHTACATGEGGTRRDSIARGPEGHASSNSWTEKSNLPRWIRERYRITNRGVVGRVATKQSG